MTTRGYRLYRLAAVGRQMHSEGHSGLNCTMGADAESRYEWVDQDSSGVIDHPDFYRDHANYMGLVAQGVPESPQCPKCFSVAPVSMHIPGKAMGGTWIRGATIRECGHCGHRTAYEPDNT